MVTGHGRTRAYLHRCRIIDSATCPCNKADQTVVHLIYQCPLLNINTQLLRKNVQQSGYWSADIQELITKHLSAFTNFTNSIKFEEL
jgi:hypothetical protein